MRKHILKVQKTGYGHWKITTTHYGKEISCTTTNSMAIDAYDCFNGEWKRGSVNAYNSLRNEIIRKNKN